VRQRAGRTVVEAAELRAWSIACSPIRSYGGTYAYGKDRTQTQYDGGEPRQGMRRKAQGAVAGADPGRARGLRELGTIRAHFSARSPGICAAYEHSVRSAPGPRWQPVLCCAATAAAISSPAYTGSQHDVLRYSCYRGWLDSGEPRCNRVLADYWSMRHSLANCCAVVQPAAIEAARLAREEQARKQTIVLAALQRDLEAARYAARRCHEAIRPLADPRID